jgi:hypothetical protein
MTIGLGASFVGAASPSTRRSLSRSLKAALQQGRAVHRLDSPRVTFNRCAGSTKGFDYVHGRNIAANALDVIAILERMTPMSCVRFSAALASPLNELSERELRPISKSLAAQTFTCSGCFGP